MTTAQPKKTFRIGVTRGEVFRPIATIGISRDAGVFIVPAPLKNQGWRYGVARLPAEATISDSQEHVTIQERPKLHYHRSGIASITLSGTQLDRRKLQLAPVEKVSRGQILSVVAIRPWMLSPAAARRKGDLMAVEPTWPQEIAFGFSLLRFKGQVPPPPAEMNEVAPFGLLTGDDSRFTVDISFYIPGMVLVGATRVSHSPTEHLEPSITVAALPWDPERNDNSASVLALWSESLRNPIVHQDPDHDVLEADRYESLTKRGKLLLASAEAHSRRLFDR